MFVVKENIDNRVCPSKEDPLRVNRFWTSGKRLNETCESTFVWKPSNDKTLAVKFVDRVEGDPNCSEGHEFCVNLWGTQGFKWYDDRCDEKTCSLCEYKP